MDAYFELESVIVSNNLREMTTFQNLKNRTELFVPILFARFFLKIHKIIAWLAIRIKMFKLIILFSVSHLKNTSKYSENFL